MIRMKVKVYVDWDENEIINEAEYEKVIAEDAKKLMSDDYELDEWLGAVEEYNRIEIFNFSDEDKQKVRAAWEEYCISCSREQCRFEEHFIEV